MKTILLKNKDKIKYKTFQDIKVLGIGQKAIKYSLNGQEPEFAYHDSTKGYIISKKIITGFDNEFWNDEVRANIEAQKQLCQENKLPMFAPDDGICWSCHKQIFTEKHSWRAHNEHITGCPECSRSYCD